MEDAIEIKRDIRRNFDQILLTAKWSLSNRMTIPALMLLYSAIDIAAGLGSPDTEISGKKRFVKWVDVIEDPDDRRGGLSHRESLLRLKVDRLLRELPDELQEE